MAGFFDIGQSRVLPWARRPQAAALVAAMADPDRAFDAIVVGEYERAFYGTQYALMAPLFEHYGVQLSMPEAGGMVDFQAEGHEEMMIGLGIQPKREITRTRIRVRTAMAAQTREQGRYLGGRPPYGYRLADAGPHPNRRTPRGDGGPGGWNPTRKPPRSCGAVQGIRVPRETPVRSPVPAGRAPAVRNLRAAAGVLLGEQPGGLPVPPRALQRQYAGLRPAEEPLYPRGSHPAASACPVHAPGRNGNNRRAEEAPHPAGSRRLNASQ